MVALLTLLGLILEGLGLSLTRAQLLPPGWAWPLALGLGCELLSVRLPGFGRVSLGLPFLLALLCHSGGFLPATLAGGALLLVRAMLEGQPDWPHDSLAGWLPLLAAGLAALSLPEGPLRWLLALHTQFVVSLAVTALLAAERLAVEARAGWRRVQGAQSAVLLGLAYLSLPALLLWQSDPRSLPVLLPVLLALRTAAQAAPLLVEDRDQQGLRRQVSLARLGLEQARSSRAQVVKELQEKAEQLGLVEGLARMLARDPDYLQILDRLLQVVQANTGCQTVALFTPQEGGLQPDRFRSPQAERLSSAAILKVREPVVEQAWSRQEPAVQPEGWTGDRLLTGERIALALPLGQLGVLYLGDRARPPFSTEELHSLRVLAAQAALSLQSARYFGGLQQALGEYRQAHASLERWSQGLSRAMEAAQALTSTLDLPALLQLLSGGVQAVVGGEWVWVVSSQAELSSGAAPEAVEQVARVVEESGRPLLFEELEPTRFRLEGASSLVAAPLAQEGAVFASLVVASPRPQAFDRLDQDLLTVLALQAGTALQNARVHREVVDAYARLQQSEQQLVQSSKMAAVGQLAAGVAHELNTPLGAVCLGLESAMMQLERQKTELAIKRMKTALESARICQEIVSKLLYYSREGRMENQPFQLDQVVGDTLRLIQQQLELDGVSLDYRPVPLPELRGSPNELQQVLLNLLINARDALREAANKTVELAASRDGDWAILSVTDHGHGMAEDVRSRIFEPFFTTKEVGQGTGLGLSISLEIMQRLGGDLSVESQPGWGTRFTLKLPIPAAQAL